MTTNPFNFCFLDAPENTYTAMKKTWSTMPPLVMSAQKKE